MAFSVNPESVQALKNYATKIEEGAEQIKNETDTMSNITDQYSGKIGPHADQIKSALDTIKGAVLQGMVPAHEISEKLNDVADAYQEVIDQNYYGGTGN